MQIWLRLLWRELRENGPFVLIGMVLPLLCLTIRNAEGKFVYGDTVNLAVCIVIIMISVWASARAQETRDNGLPIAPHLRLATRYLIPISGVLLIGAALGYLAALRLTVSEQFDMIPLMIGMCACVYLFCAVVSVVYAMIPAVLVGLSLALLCFFPEFYTPAFHWLLLRILLVVLMTGICLEGYRGRHRIIIGRIALPLLVMAAFLWGTVDAGILRKPFIRHSQQLSNVPNDGVYAFYNFDGTLHSGDDVDRDRSRIFMQDERIPSTYFIARNRLALPGEYLRSLGCLERHVMLYAVQTPGQAQVRVIAWDVWTGQVRERFRFTGWPGMLVHSSYPCQSPDGRYSLFGVTSKAGWGEDIWLIDLQRQHAALVIPNFDCRVESDGSSYYAIYTPLWNADRLVVQSDRQTVSLNLHTLRVTPVLIGGQL